MGNALDKIYIIKLNTASMLCYSTAWKLKSNNPHKFQNVKPTKNNIFIYSVSYCCSLYGALQAFF